jgi:hypothetical protein
MQQSRFAAGSLDCFLPGCSACAHCGRHALGSAALRYARCWASTLAVDVSCGRLHGSRVLGLSAFWFLDNRSSNASWLPAEEKQALANALALEEKERRSAGPAKLLPMFRDLRVMQFLMIYALIQIEIV